MSVSVPGWQLMGPRFPPVSLAEIRWGLCWTAVAQCIAVLVSMSVRHSVVGNSSVHPSFQSENVTQAQIVKFAG